MSCAVASPSSSLSLIHIFKAELVQKIDIVANTVGNVANQQELLAKHLSDAAASLEMCIRDRLDTINSMTPIWKKRSSDVSDEDYNEFYKSTFHDLSLIHI